MKTTTPIAFDPRRTARRGALPVILLVASVAMAVAWLTPATAAGQDVPFKARSSGTPAWTSPTTVETHGTGTATGVGRFVDSGFVVLSAAAPGCPGGGLGLPHVHTETLTAVDGGKLVLRLLGLACPTGPNSWHGTGTWTVVDGTGRFEGMTGHGTFEGSADFAAGECELDFEGTISHP